MVFITIAVAKAIKTAVELKKGTYAFLITHVNVHCSERPKDGL